MKLCAPYFIQAIPYSARIILFAALSTIGMLLIALTPAYTDGGNISTKMAGIVLASLSSGGGELSFLGLTHFYGPFSLAAWGSGTGAAGLVGAGAYAVATTAFRMSVKTTLFASSFLPIIMLLSFFLILPPKNLRKSIRTGYRSEEAPDHSQPDDNLSPTMMSSEAEHGEQPVVDGEEEERLLATSKIQDYRADGGQSWWMTFESNLKRARGLFFPL